ncbi:MAG: universal stress protein [Bacteroidetes bacterium]|nr:MAG: universal stress protein [Bacteroidota bacterium]
MGKLLAAIDYGPASAAVLQALLPLRRKLRDSLVLYHAYQLPRGLPFLSAHVIEQMEKEAAQAAHQRLREFVAAHVPSQERRSVRLVSQRDFLTEGLHRYLQSRSYRLLALGAQGQGNESEGAIGFHTRHFIHHASIPVLVVFPESRMAWKRMLVVYDADYRSPEGVSFLRTLTRKVGTQVAALPLLRPDGRIERMHTRLQRLLQASDYEKVSWSGPRFVQLILSTAHAYEADLIVLFSDPAQALEGMRTLPMETFVGGPGWLFLPHPAPPAEEAPTPPPE